MSMSSIKRKLHFDRAAVKKQSCFTKKLDTFLKTPSVKRRLNFGTVEVVDNKKKTCVNGGINDTVDIIVAVVEQKEQLSELVKFIKEQTRQNSELTRRIEDLECELSILRMDRISLDDSRWEGECEYLI